MKKILYLFSAISILGISASSQTVGPVKRIPLDYDTPIITSPFSTPYYGPFCSGDRAYAVVRLKMTSTERSDVGIIYPLDGSGPPIVKPVNLPHVKNHNTCNAVFVFQGQPCIIHDTWNKETGEITLHLQRYSPATFEEVGDPQLIGNVTLTPNGALPADLNLLVRYSPNGRKALLYFDDLQVNSFKVAMCWVLGEDFAVEWNGSYKLPLFVKSAGSIVKIKNDGSVLVSMTAVRVTDELTVKDDNGNDHVKFLVASTSPQTFSCYRMNGQEFQHWNGQIGGDRFLIAGCMEESEDAYFVAGLVTKTAESDELNWVMVQLDDELQPIDGYQEGPTPDFKWVKHRIYDYNDTELISGADGNMLYLAAGESSTIALAFGVDGMLRWSTNINGAVMPTLFTKGNEIYGGADLSAKYLESIKGGKTKASIHDRRPVLFRWDELGSLTYTPIIPFNYPIRKSANYYSRSSFSGITEIGQYVDWDNEDRPSLNQVSVD
jgi:hypothetical protein